MYSDVNNLYGWAMSEKFPVDGFKWINKVSKFNKHFIKIMMKTVKRGILLK